VLSVRKCGHPASFRSRHFIMRLISERVGKLNTRTTLPDDKISITYLGVMKKVAIFTKGMFSHRSDEVV
jgi:hypothetical protein